MKTSSTIFDAVSNLDRSKLKIVLVVDDIGVFQGTVCDGDIRRGMLNGIDLNSNITEIINYNALVLPPNVGPDQVQQLMTANNIQQVPIIDDDGLVVGAHFWDDFIKPVSVSNLMVIMAGGLGRRMQPFTESCPKPMLPVAGKPMLEHIINRAKSQGFNRFVISIFHLGDMIKEYFGYGENLGVVIEYIEEETPLGTAGALALLDKELDKPFVLTNGDVITNIRYDEMLHFHNDVSATATMAVRVHEIQNPFGVVVLEGAKILGFNEKPIYRDHINAGVYVFEPSVLGFLRGQHCDMPQLFAELISASNRIIAYPIHESWIDIGRPDDYNLIKGNLERVMF